MANPIWKETRDPQRHFSAVYGFWFNLPSWKALHPTAVSILLELMMLHRPNECLIEISNVRLAALANCSVPTLLKYREQLIETGWIDIYNFGNFFGEVKSERVTSYHLQMLPADTAPVYVLNKGYAVWGDGIELYFQGLKGNTEENHTLSHFRLYHHWRDLPAWRTLTPLARYTLLILSSKFRPNKRKIEFSANQVRRMCKCRAKKAQQAIDELLEKGWVELVDFDKTDERKASRSKAYSYQQFGDTFYGRAKRRFLKWKPKNQ